MNHKLMWIIFVLGQAIPIISIILISWMILHFFFAQPAGWSFLEALGVMYVVYLIAKLTAAMTTKQWRAL